MRVFEQQPHQPFHVSPLTLHSSLRLSFCITTLLGTMGKVAASLG